MVSTRPKEEELLAAWPEALASWAVLEASMARWWLVWTWSATSRTEADSSVMAEAMRSVEVRWESALRASSRLVLAISWVAVAISLLFCWTRMASKRMRLMVVFR